MTWLRFWFKRSKFKVTPSRQRLTALDERRVQLFLVSKYDAWILRKERWLTIVLLFSLIIIEIFLSDMIHFIDCHYNFICFLCALFILFDACNIYLFFWH